MTGNPYKIRGTENEREIVVNHGQFYRSAELVSNLHRGSGGILEVFVPRTHFGRFSPAYSPRHRLRGRCRARRISRARRCRFGAVLGVSGDPSQKPSNVVAMATKFYLPDGTVTDLIAITLPAFFARTPEEFITLVNTSMPDAATGKPDLAKLQPFLTGNPNAAKVAQVVQSQQACVSFAQVSYRPLHTYSTSRTRPEKAVGLGTTGSQRPG